MFKHACTRHTKIPTHTHTHTHTITLRDTHLLKSINELYYTFKLYYAVELEQTIIGVLDPLGVANLTARKVHVIIKAASEASPTVSGRDR